MRKVALVVLAALVLSVYAPRVQAQPFADVPTDIFAFDAVAELAAKGIIEGYPDGTFKGDRAMTRYEMAMVVARILARIEAIKIPPPPAAPPAGVAPKDLAAVQRLVNEFRAELAAQGVRVTAVEEELAALRARLSNVRFTGDLQFRYAFLPTSSANSAPLIPSVFLRTRLQFEGKAASNVTAVARVTTGNTTSSRFSFSQVNANAALGEVNFDKSYLDVDPLFGLSFRLGRQYYTLAPVGLQGYGLLFDPQEGQVGGSSSVAGSLGFGIGFGASDGLLVKGAFSGFNFEAGVWRFGTLLTTAPFTPPFGTASIGDFWTGSVSMSPMPGWTVRLSGLVENWNGAASAAGNPGFPGTNDTGYSVDASGTIFPGVSLGAAYAAWTGHSTAVTTVSSSAWEVWTNINLTQVAGLSMWSPTLGLSYKNYGTAGSPGCFFSTTTVCPLFTAAMTDTAEGNNWNFQGWSVLVNLKFTPDLSGTLQYESGNTINPNGGQFPNLSNVLAPAGATTYEWYADLSYNLASRLVLHGRWFYQQYSYTGAGSGDYTNFYRIQLDYSY